jgi:hypothetical protein
MPELRHRQSQLKEKKDEIDEIDEIDDQSRYCHATGGNLEN